MAFFLSPGFKPAGLPELPGALGLDKAYILMFYWGKGFWVLLTFAMQMCLIIVTGYIVVVSPPFRKLLNWLAGLPKSPKGVIALMALVSMVLSFFNWGLSIVGSAKIRGKVTENIGVFSQITYDNYAAQGVAPDGTGAAGFQGHTNADNIDLRYAERFIDTNRDLIVGVSANNNPSVSDPWNTSAAWMQYVPVPSPSSSAFIDGNAP